MSTEERRSARDLPAGTRGPAGAPPPGPSATAAGDRAAEGDQVNARRLEEAEDRWRRAAADLANLRRRHAGELAREREAERARVAGAWLPVLDHLELALAHAGADPRSIVSGVEAVRDQAVGVLRQLGYPRHDEVGMAFDPARHDVMTVIPESDVPVGTVVRVLRPGYGDVGRQLRPVGVAVSRPAARAADGTGTSAGDGPAGDVAPGSDVSGSDVSGSDVSGSDAPGADGPPERERAE
jgi:molecular chaperone GrpE